MNREVISQEIAEARFKSAGLSEKHLADFDFPPTELAVTPSGEQVPYKVFGNQNAPTYMFAVSPYGTTVYDKSQEVRLAAQQIALGDEACVVGLHVYEPGKLSGHKSFVPYAERVLSVIEAVDPEDDQEVALYGFSLGADVNIETAYQVTTSENKGIREINRLGAVDPARSDSRGPIAKARAFAGSGKMLHENVLASNSPALLEARGIDLSDPDAQKKHDKAVAIGIVRSWMHDISGQIANMRGFGGDRSLQELNEMIEADTLPKTVAGRLKCSPVCLPYFLDHLLPHPNLSAFEISGDHTTADNVRTSGAFAVRAVLL